jgi:hypothetical protein
LVYLEDAGVFGEPKRSHDGLGLTESVLTARQQYGAEAAHAPRGGDKAGERKGPPWSCRTCAGRQMTVAAHAALEFDGLGVDEAKRLG